MKYLKRAVSLLLALGMLASAAGCKDKNENVETTDTPVSVVDHVSTSDTPSDGVPTYKIGKVTFRQDTTELQLGDVNFTEQDLDFISKCTNLQYFGVLSSNLSDLAFLENLNDLRTIVIGTSDMSDLRTISGLKSLESLSIINANLTSTSPITLSTASTISKTAAASRRSTLSPTSSRTSRRLRA